MIYLHKILPFFLSPLGIILIFLILSFFYKRRFFVFLAFLVLIFSSNSFVATYLFNQLEKPYKPIAYQSVNNADAIVVLSGGINQIQEGEVKRYQWGLPNRFFSGVELLKQRKSDKIIFTGGQLPWDNTWSPEGVILKNKAIELGIDTKKILVSDKVQTTYDESVKVSSLLPNNSSIILVTSAYHMKRSKFLFEKQGLKVIPFPVDFYRSSSNITILNVIPSLSAIKGTSMFIRENIGRLYYKLFF